jgi:RNA polymerase sigma factor (sigma-70 family)
VEGYALSQERFAARRGPSRMLRLASDERLVALTRAGNQGAFEVIVDRYQARLKAFCARIVGSREDAEDVLQEVFAAAFNALCADAREINLRPWLYRIARNRSLNHLRRHTAIGVDSMDVHFAEMGLSTSDKVFKREEFKLLVGDIGQLPESQRTALLLREIEGMSYEQIAVAMDQTVPGIKSLLVRARVGLGEASEARKLSCEDVRVELGAVAEGITSLSQPVRRHLKACERCSDFRGHLRSNNRALAALAPFGPLLLLKQLLAAKLGIGAGGAGATAGSGAAASGGAAAGGAAAVGGSTAGTVTATAVAAKAVAALAAAAAVTAGAVAVAPVHHHPRQSAASFTQPPVTLPQSMIAASSAPAVAHDMRRRGAATQTLAASAITVTSPALSGVAGATGVTGSTTVPNTEEVTTTTAFPGAAAGPTGATGSSPVTAAVTPGVAATLPSTLTGTTSAAGATGASGSATGTTGASGSTGSTSGSAAAGATGASGISGP